MLKINSVRTFIGAKDFEVSRSFYRELGFSEGVISDDLSVFETGDSAFYLQKYYVEDWVSNSMLFFVVNDVEKCYQDIQQLQLDTKYPGVRVLPIKKDDWGSECFVIDPAGVLLHFAQFNED
jgi:catechol 2,3-dioxygenase-like lactoylglutathione lyase family enzyme